MRGCAHPSCDTPPHPANVRRSKKKKNIKKKSCVWFWFTRGGLLEWEGVGILPYGTRIVTPVTFILVYDVARNDWSSERT